MLDTADFYPDDGSVAVADPTVFEATTVPPGSSMMLPFRNTDAVLVPSLQTQTVEWVGTISDFPGWGSEVAPSPITHGVTLASTTLSEDGGSYQASRVRVVWPWLPPRGDLWRQFRLVLGLQARDPEGVLLSAELYGDNKLVLRKGDEADPPAGYDEDDTATWRSSEWLVAPPPVVNGLVTLDVRRPKVGYHAWLAIAVGVGVSENAVFCAFGSIPGGFARHGDIQALRLGSGGGMVLL
jgi:hypothetical protein